MEINRNVIRHEFRTTDEHGNKIMDKMTKEETLKAMQDIRSQYGEEVIIEFSGDGMAALVESKKGMDSVMVQGQQEAMEAKNAAFQSEIKQLDGPLLNHLPEYSGIYEADKAIAAAVEHCSKEEQAFVYDIIRQNFLIQNSGSMTEEERQLNISLGMKKAEQAAESFLPESSRASFLKAMEQVAKLASAGTADSDGKMDYGISKGRYLGHGSNLVRTTDSVDMMRTMDPEAYEEYRSIDASKDGGAASLKYMVNWYSNAVRKHPSMVSNYERQLKESYENILQRRESLKTAAKLVFENHHEASLAGEMAKLREQRGNGTYSLSDKLEDYAKAYGSLYDEIVQGYKNGTRELYVEDEDSETGFRRLTMEEELSSLEKAYQKAADRENALAENARKAAAAFKETGKKLSKIKNGMGASFLNAYERLQEEENVTQGNIGQKMTELAQVWKDVYQASGSKENGIEKVLSMLKAMFQSGRI